MVNCGLTPSLGSGTWNQGHSLLGDCGMLDFGIQNPRLSWIPLHGVTLHYESKHFGKIEGHSACRVTLKESMRET